MSVRLAFGGDDARLTVTDSGAPPGPAGGMPAGGMVGGGMVGGGVPAGGVPGGYGLTGLRERAELAGGTFSAGPSEGSGWRVEVVLPVTVP